MTVASLSAGVSDAITDRQVMLIMMRQLTLLESKIDRLQCEVDAQRKQIAFQPRVNCLWRKKESEAINWTIITGGTLLCGLLVIFPIIFYWFYSVRGTLF